MHTHAHALRHRAVCELCVTHCTSISLPVRAIIHTHALKHRAVCVVRHPLHRCCAAHACTCTHKLQNRAVYICACICGGCASPTAPAFRCTCVQSHMHTHAHALRHRAVCELCVTHCTSILLHMRAIIHTHALKHRAVCELCVTHCTSISLHMRACAHTNCKTGQCMHVCAFLEVAHHPLHQNVAARVRAHTQHTHALKCRAVCACLCMRKGTHTLRYADTGNTKNTHAWVHMRSAPFCP